MRFFAAWLFLAIGSWRQHGLHGGRVHALLCCGTRHLLY